MAKLAEERRKRQQEKAQGFSFDDEFGQAGQVQGAGDLNKPKKENLFKDPAEFARRLQEGMFGKDIQQKPFE
jgi:hypothetical protein